jgi:pimeloyl-ACP methyl ester carboxylesterase
MLRLFFVALGCLTYFGSLLPLEEQGGYQNNFLTAAFAMRDQISYRDFVFLSNTREPFLMGQESIRGALEKNRYFNESILFYTKFLRRRVEVREFLRAPRHLEGKYLRTRTCDDETIHYTYFNRGSDTLLVIGGGTMNQERVASFVQMFPRYDVVIFNHRGVSYNMPFACNPFNWGHCFVTNCVLNGANSSKMQYGRVEENDVIAVIFDIFKRKTYKKVYGLGICYSAPIFIKTAVVRPGIFDKLVVDGGWISIAQTVERFTSVVIDEISHRWWGKLLPVKAEWFYNFLSEVGKFFGGLDQEKISYDFTPYLRQLKIPIFMIHSANDRVVPNEEFELFWNFLGSEKKVAMLTMGGHISNHLKHKEVYAHTVEAFFDRPSDEFLTSVLL